MGLTGREAEIKQLEEFYSSRKAEFQALYGRRRAGKSLLIQQFYQKKPSINFHVTGLKDGTLKEQIEVFNHGNGAWYVQCVQSRTMGCNWSDIKCRLSDKQLKDLTT